MNSLFPNLSSMYKIRKCSRTSWWIATLINLFNPGGRHPPPKKKKNSLQMEGISADAGAMIIKEKYRISIHHWRWLSSIDQLTNFDDLKPILNTFTSKFVSCCQSYLSWGSLWSVADWEMATLASFQALEILSELANSLKISIQFSWHLFLAIVLGLELQLEHFGQVCRVIFERADWQLDISHFEFC